MSFLLDRHPPPVTPDSKEAAEHVQFAQVKKVCACALFAFSVFFRIPPHRFPLSSPLVAYLTESTCSAHDGAAMREALARDGYLYLKNIIPPAKIRAARAKIRAGNDKTIKV